MTAAMSLNIATGTVVVMSRSLPALKPRSERGIMLMRSQPDGLKLYEALLGIEPIASKRCTQEPRLRSLLLHFSFRLLTARAIEHEYFWEPSEARDRLDELHRLPTIGARGRSWRVGQHAVEDRLSHR